LFLTYLVLWPQIVWDSVKNRYVDRDEEGNEDDASNDTKRDAPPPTDAEFRQKMLPSMSSVAGPAQNRGIFNRAKTRGLVFCLCGHTHLRHFRLLLGWQRGSVVRTSVFGRHTSLTCAWSMVDMNVTTVYYGSANQANLNPSKVGKWIIDT